MARALSNDPKIIIADEPTGSLDLKSSNEVMSIMEKQKRRRSHHHYGYS
jgi:ABC-type lipoprotein export system ATPase subunit